MTVQQVLEREDGGSVVLVRRRKVEDARSDWGMRTAAFTDPDGHVWEVAQELRGPGSTQA